MAEGAVYVEVAGNAIGYGIATLNTSGDDNPGEGETSDRYWLHWSYNAQGVGGFSGYSWHWDDSNNYLDNAWESWRLENGYTTEDYAGVTGFQKYLDEAEPQNLDHLFNIWASTASKAEFAQMLILAYGFWPDGGCVELT